MDQGYAGIAQRRGPLDVWPHGHAGRREINRKEDVRDKAHAALPGVEATNPSLQIHGIDGRTRKPSRETSPACIILHMRSCHFAPLVFAILLGMAVVQSIFSQTTQPGSTSQMRPVQVPFVGCASDGQMGPLKAPMGQGKQVEIPAGDANRLAYYGAKYGPGVLAPRGWHCFSTYGSNGSNLYVSPDPIDTKNVFAPDWKGFTGDAVQVSVSLGGTSGRFQVAKIIARVFPAFKEFAQNVIAEGIEPAADFPFGPYAKDKLRYIGDRIVEFETPAQAEGLGTDSQLQRNGKPIRGVAILLGETPDLTLLSIRIPDANLVPVIMKSIEGEAADSESKSKSQN